MRPGLLTLPLCTALAACATSAPRVDVSPAEVNLPPAASSGGSAETSAAPAPAAEPEDDTPAVLTRSALRRAVAQGIGAFLADVAVTPVVQHGRFAGFRLDRARGLRRWNTAGLALRAGDVVTRVNGSPIERPEQAQAVFQRAAEADAIVVDVLRDGAPVTLRIPVAPDPAAGAVTAAR